MGCLQQFASLVYAVNCVIANQSATEESAALLLDERSIRFRIGVKIDEVIMTGNDFFGDGANIVAQLEDLAEPSCGKPHLMNHKAFRLIVDPRRDPSTTAWFLKGSYRGVKDRRFLGSQGLAFSEPV